MSPKEREQIQMILESVRAASRETREPHTTAALVGIAIELRELLGHSASDVLSEARVHHAPASLLRCPRCRARVGALLPHRDGQGACCAICLDESRPRRAEGGMSQ